MQCWELVSLKGLASEMGSLPSSGGSVSSLGRAAGTSP